MADYPSVRFTKSFTYRGAARIFSNRYHFSGGVPADDTAWEALLDAIEADELAIYADSVTIHEGYGLPAGSDVPAFSKLYDDVGTGGWSSSTQAPGDCAALVRYATAALSTKRHPIYLMNYYHGCYLSSSLGTDFLNTTEKTALEEYADDWLAGFTAGGITAVRAGPHGATAVSRAVDQYVHHRDFLT